MPGLALIIYLTCSNLTGAAFADSEIVNTENSVTIDKSNLNCKFLIALT